MQQTPPSPHRRKFIQQASILTGAFFASSLASADEESMPSLMRTMPFLQNPTDGGITVTWLTNAPAYSYVEYGEDKDNLQKALSMVDGQVIAGNTIHRIRLHNIEAGKTYYYRVVSQEILTNQAYKKKFGPAVISEFFHFFIPREKDDYRAVVFNDLHRRNKTTEHLVKLLDGKPYHLALFNGDCIDDPQNEEDIVNFLEHAARVVGKGCIPMVFIRGNHEIRGAYSIFLRDYIEYSTPQSYGGFSWGSTRYVILDCGEDKPDDHWVYYGLNDFSGFRREQVDFLKRELNSNAFLNAQERILIHHIPIYLPESIIDYNPCHDLWASLLKDATFFASINGHTHEFAFYPKGELQGNNFPIIVGGGPSLKEAGLVIIDKKPNAFTVSYINSEGEEEARISSDSVASEDTSDTIVL